MLVDLLVGRLYFTVLVGGLVRVTPNLVYPFEKDKQKSALPILDRERQIKANGPLVGDFDHHPLYVVWHLKMKIDLNRENLGTIP